MPVSKCRPGRAVTLLKFPGRRSMRVRLPGASISVRCPDGSGARKRGCVQGAPAAPSPGTAGGKSDSRGCPPTSFVAHASCAYFFFALAFTLVFGFFLAAFFLWLTIGAFGSSRVLPEYASDGQPFGRPRSNGPAIACVTTPFSRYA